MKTSSSVGFATVIASIMPGKAPTSWGMNSWPFRRSMRTVRPTTPAVSPNFLPISRASPCGVVGGDGDDVAADGLPEGVGGAVGDDRAAVHDGDAVAAFGFVEEMRREDDRHPFAAGELPEDAA